MTDVMHTELAEAWINRAPVQDIEHMLDEYRCDPASYRVLKRQVERIRKARVRVEHDYPRVRYES